MIRSSTLTIQKKKNGIERIWIEGKYLEEPGFTSGTKIKLIYKSDMIIIIPKENGDRIVSGKKRPIIDINNLKIRHIFKSANKVNVIVELGRIIIKNTKITLRKLSVIKNGTFASVFGGGGLIDLAAQNNGFTSLWTIEKEKKYADVWQKNFNGIVYNCSVEEVNYDELEHPELLLAGIPCTPHSKINYTDKEIHPDIDTTIHFVSIVEKTNPNTIIIEEIPEYLKSDLCKALINSLRKFGYNVEYKILCGKNYNELTSRTRLVIIASYDEISWINEEKHTVKVSDILLKPNHPKCKWFTKESKPYFFEKKKGNFISGRQIITKDTEFINTISKKYLESQQQSPIVKHPTKPNTFRLLTAIELRKISGLPNSFDSDADWITGHITGNGVLVKLFTKIIGEMI